MDSSQSTSKSKSIIDGRLVVHQKLGAGSYGKVKLTKEIGLKSVMSEMCVKSQKFENSEMPEKSEKSKKSEKSEKSEKSKKSEKFYATKIFPHSKKNFNLDRIKKEFKIGYDLSKDDHPNFIKHYEFVESAVYNSKSKGLYKCTVILLEPATNNRLFDYLNCRGRFSENLARLYFRVLINAIEHMHHVVGYAHLDLKPGNLLFDSDFNLKIIDFGFSMFSMENINKRRGTPGYQAPEIYICEKDYEPKKADVFALGVILFVMVFGFNPFSSATIESGRYALVMKKNYKEFWQYQEEAYMNKWGKRFSEELIYPEEFKDLIWNMILSDPNERYDLNKINKHHWYHKMKLAGKEELTEYFSTKRAEFEMKLKQIKEKEIEERGTRSIGKLIQDWIDNNIDQSTESRDIKKVEIARLPISNAYGIFPVDVKELYALFIFYLKTVKKLNFETIAESLNLIFKITDGEYDLTIHIALYKVIQEDEDATMTYVDFYNEEDYTYLFNKIVREFCDDVKAIIEDGKEFNKKLVKKDLALKD